MADSAAVSADTTTAPEVLYEVAEHVATITFNRPERMNTISGPMLNLLTQHLVAADRDRDVRAVILTHGDADHKGSAEKLRAEQGLPVHVHAADAALTCGKGSRPREASLLPYLRHAATWKIIGAFIRGGRPQHVREVQTFEDGAALDVPGKPRVIHAPGHSAGCVAFHFEQHDAGESDHIQSQLRYGRPVSAGGQRHGRPREQASAICPGP